jgi:hypothetical protein
MEERDNKSTITIQSDKGYATSEERPSPKVEGRHWTVTQVLQHM